MRYSSSEDDLEFSFDSGPRKSPIDKTKSLKKKNKCFYIIVIISVVVLLFVGIFLAIFFAAKKKENGGYIIIIYFYNSTIEQKIINPIDLKDDDYDIKNIEDIEDNSPNTIKDTRILSGKGKNYHKGNKLGKQSIKITFNKILTTLNGMFANIDNLIEADFSNLESKKIINMNNLFANCIRLENVNFNEFDAKKLETMDNCFLNCKEITDIDLDSFTTPKLYSMNSAFKNCTNLHVLNIHNFIINSGVDWDDLFYGIDNKINFQLPKGMKDMEDIIKSNEQCNNEKDTGCVKCDNSDLSFSICAQCNEGYYLPGSKYPLKCNKCADNCLICTDYFFCKNCTENYYIDYSTGKCEKYYSPTDELSDISDSQPF